MKIRDKEGKKIKNNHGTKVFNILTYLHMFKDKVLANPRETIKITTMAMWMNCLVCYLSNILNLYVSQDFLFLV